MATWQRSIPASAGEPQEGGCNGLCIKVYPRECGGTVVVNDKAPLTHGLSPRVRGNPGRIPLGAWDRRSIPASAGEPLSERSTRESLKVYPRECGGTRPRRRNESRLVAVYPRECGEPRLHPGMAAAMAVYPRECGGTPISSGIWRGGPGLSPRVRGNRLVGIGQPRVGQVYPRECGGTWRYVQHQCPDCGLSPRVRGNRPARFSGPL